MGNGLAGEANASPEDIAAYYDAWAAGAYDADVTMSEPLPYLPGHDEFGTAIGIIYTVLTKRG